MTSAPPQRTVRLLGRPGHVFEATLWGIRHCQQERLRIDVEAMEGYAEASLLLLADVVRAHGYVRRRKSAR